MKVISNFFDRDTSCRTTLTRVLFLLMITAITSCSGKTKTYNILEFTGDELIMSFTRSLFTIWSVADSNAPTAIIAADGDLIGYGDNRFLLYRESTGLDSFDIRTSRNISYINGKVSSVTIPDNDEMIPWFKELKSTDLSALDFIYFKEQIPENYIPYLTELSGIKPGIGLGYGENLKDIEKMLKIFKPEFIIGGDLSQEEFSLLSGLDNLKILGVSFSDSLYSEPLPAMKQLKQLIIQGNKGDPFGKIDFLANNRQIENISVFSESRFDLSLIKNLLNLKELIISKADSLDNFSLIKSHKKLEVLSLNGKISKNIEILKELSNIRWIIFDETVKQEEFNSFIRDHPSLEIVEVANNDLIPSLKPLSELRTIYGLTVSDTVIDLATLKSLKTLKFLSLPDDILADSTIKSDLQIALPNAKIVANEGVCLGSGWLLLIFPLILIIKAISEKRRHQPENQTK